MNPSEMIAKSADELRCFRISPNDTNYFALLFDPLGDDVNFTLVVEIFEPGGATPPNTHQIAEEVFFVLAGEGIAHAGGQSRPLRAGDCMVLRPGTEHVVENPGPGKLYCLTFMAPNEGFAELIRGGTEMTLPAEDLAVLRHLAA